MEKNPRCKKCGRLLKSPLSIASGMGPKCAGVSLRLGKVFVSRNNQVLAGLISDEALDPRQAPLFHWRIAKEASEQERIVSPTKGGTPTTV